jgi:hypothetical protein
LVQVKKENRRSRRMKLRNESNNRQRRRKLNLKFRRKKVPADAAIAYGLIYRHTRQAPSSHWATPNYPMARMWQAVFKKYFPPSLWLRFFPNPFTFGRNSLVNQIC